MQILYVFGWLLSYCFSLSILCLMIYFNKVIMKIMSRSLAIQCAVLLKHLIRFKSYCFFPKTKLQTTYWQDIQYMFHLIIRIVQCVCFKKKLIKILLHINYMAFIDNHLPVYFQKLSHKDLYYIYIHRSINALSYSISLAPFLFRKDIL